jgi:hypothetical protein
MTRARSPEARAAVQSGARAALLLWLLAGGAARAQPNETAPATCEDAACECEQHGDCWDFQFLSSGSNAQLGLSTVLSAVRAGGEDDVDVGVLASYRADVYRARGLLNNHVFARGAIGAGSAGNQGELAGSLDFGVRLPVTQVSGPVLRLGPSGSLFGNDAMQLAMLEPLRLLAGYQQLLGDTLLEGGMTTSLLGMGRFSAGERSANLTGSLALGHYLAAHFPALRFDGRVGYVGPPFGADMRVGILALEACALPRPLALCADLRYAQGSLPRSVLSAHKKHAPEATARALYTGFTIALTP